MGESITCTFCDAEFIIEEIDVTEKVSFCPYCGYEILNEENDGEED
jgi:DNA-directed RNA polymerase subunit RPC12/RpoP